MAAPKRRKPGDPTARLEAQAAAAWARQNAKLEVVEARDKAREEEKAAREREAAAGHAEAEAATRTLQARLTELETLLASTLGEDPYLPFDRLKEPMPRAQFQPPPHLAAPAPAPELTAFLPQPPSGPGALLPGRKRAHAEAVAQRRAAYEQEAAEHARAEQDRLEQLARARAAYERALAGERERVRRQHAAIDQMASDFAVGKRKAVADYFTEVLAVQSYPGDFPTGVKIAYKPAAGEIIVDIDLPLMDAVPELASCEYLPGKKELRYKKLTLADRNRRYQLIIAQMTLRTLRCILLLFRAIPDFDEVRKTRSRNDGGIDVVAVNKNEFTGGRVAIQAKCYATHHKVAIAEVREMVGAISQREFHKGIIVTTSGYTTAAREEAARHGIELYDGERLLWLLDHHLRREYTIIDTDRRSSPIRKLPHAGGPS